MRLEDMSLIRTSIPKRLVKIIDVMLMVQLLHAKCFQNWSYFIEIIYLDVDFIANKIKLNAFAAICLFHSITVQTRHFLFECKLVYTNEAGLYLSSIRSWVVEYWTFSSRSFLCVQQWSILFVKLKAFWSILAEKCRRKVQKWIFLVEY